MPETLENTTATDRKILVSNQLRAADNEAQPASRQTTGQEHSMRFVLVHDDALVRVDIRELLFRMKGIEVGGQYARCDQVLNLIKQLRSDLVLLDITVPVRGETAQEVQSIINEERLLHSLTPRKRQILTLIAQGYNTKGIAFALNISTKTVESHRAQLMGRLGIHDIAGLVRFAIRMGLVKAEER